MINQAIQTKNDHDFPPDGCGIIIEFFDIPNPEPGPDSSNAADFVDARIKSVKFVRDIGEGHQQQIIEFRFNIVGQIEIRETNGGFIDVVIPDKMTGDLYTLVQSFKIT